MDSITQAVLGAAVGEAVLGPRVGRKAAIWGAVAGTIPDLDIVTAPFFSEQLQLAMHRGMTHSIPFALLGGPAFGWCVWRLHRRRNRKPVRKEMWLWMLLGFLAFQTHSLLDAFTVYGTQLLVPFSTQRIAWSSIFIIDPLYTGPLALGLLGAWWFRRNDRFRRRATAIGLTLSTLYLGLTLFNQAQATDAFGRELARQDLPHENILVAPTAMNSLLWMTLSDDPAEDAVWVGFHSLLDEPGPIEFRRVDKHSERIAGLRGNSALERLLWFSGGWYTIEETDRGLVLHDIRFGRSDIWLTERGRFLFSFLLPMQPGNPSPDDFESLSMGLEREASGPPIPSFRTLLPRFLRRIAGDRTP